MAQLLLSILFIFLTHVGQVVCLNDEGYTLLSFKQSITEDPNGALMNWNASDDNPCMWNGVTCIDVRVISLVIPMKGIKGFIPSALGSLTQLRRVNLRNNKLFGNVPLQLFQAQSLQNLVLSENSLSGSLPVEIGKLQNIHTLDLSRNSFNGSLPQSLIQCRGLRRLILSRNKFTGSLPEGFGTGLVMLEMVDLSYNDFSGLIPDAMGNLSRLQGTLDLSHNGFTGLIPSSLGNLPEKVYIDLSYNNLSGPIPQNGPLANRGPTAFIGNPGLCGPPLKIPCSSDSPGVSSAPFPRLPTSVPSQTSYGDGGKGKGLRKSYLIAIVVCNVFGICLIGLFLSCCYYGVCCVKSGNKDNVGDKEMKRSKECLCFRNDDSGPLSETGEQSDLVLLDLEARYDLDELLKASAFVLGKNGIGIMYKVVLEDGLTLAVRRLGEGGYQRFKEFQTEVEAIGKIRHPNIVTLKAYYWSVDEKLLIYDYIPNGSLTAAIHGKPGFSSSIPLSWPDRLKIMKGTANGLTHLHEFSPKKYVHGDVKPSNILLGHNMEPKISGFGLGRLANIAVGSTTAQSIRMPAEKPQHRRLGSALSEPIEFRSTTNVLSCYQAPESFQVVKPSQKWDVYSFGVVCLELITGRSALVKAGNSEMDLVHWVLSCIEGKKPLAHVLDPYLAHEIVDEVRIMECIKLSMTCVHSNPEKRPTMRHALDTLNRLIPSFD